MANLILSRGDLSPPSPPPLLASEDREARRPAAAAPWEKPTTPSYPPSSSASRTSIASSLAVGLDPDHQRRMATSCPSLSGSSTGPARVGGCECQVVRQSLGCGRYNSSARLGAHQRRIISSFHHLAPCSRVGDPTPRSIPYIHILACHVCRKSSSKCHCLFIMRGPTIGEDELKLALELGYESSDSLRKDFAALLRPMKT
jgi:hypothetical protein